MSRFPLGEGVMGFGGDDREFQNVAARVEKRMKDIGGGVDFAINMSFLTRIAEGLHNMGRAAAEMGTKVRLGKADFSDLFEEVAKGIPIIGKFISAGRDIRELITGEKAYTEVIKQQTEAQNERIRATAGWIEAMTKLQRRGEDLDRGAGSPGFTNSFSGIAAGAARETEDLPGKLQAEFQKQFDDFASQRKALGDKLQKLQEQNKPVVLTGGDSPFSDVIPPQFDEQIAAAQKSIAEIDKQSQELRKKMESVREKTQRDVGRTSTNQFADLLGETFTKGLRTALAAVDSFIPRLPKLASATQQAVNDAGGKLLDFQNKMAAFRADLGKGLIKQGEFDKISFNTLNKDFGADFWKATGTSIADGFSQFQAAVDPKLGNLISNIREKMSGILSTFGIGPSVRAAGAVAAPAPFRASLVGLEQLGKNIQESAGSGRDKTQDGILKAVQDGLAAEREQVRILKNLKGPIG